jgi:hypothetical protein
MKEATLPYVTDSLQPSWLCSTRLSSQDLFSFLAPCGCRIPSHVVCIARRIASQKVQLNAAERTYRTRDTHTRSCALPNLSITTERTKRGESKKIRERESQIACLQTQVRQIGRPDPVDGTQNPDVHLGWPCPIYL